MRDQDRTAAGDSRLGSAEGLLVEWLESRRAKDGVPFEDLCARHPQQAAELEELYAKLLRVVSLGSIELDSDGASGSPEANAPRARAAGGTSRFAETLRALARRRSIESRYEVGDEFSRGGMGRLMRARDLDLHRDVARKSLIDSSKVSETGLGRFLDEAQVTAQLEHPGVVPVHDIGLDSNGELFFTMSLVSGRDLGQVYREVWAGGEWSATRVVDVLLKVAETMAYAHSRRVLHRDLKPRNVMVGEFGQVYVLDWGVAKVLRPPGEGAEAVLDEHDASESDSDTDVLTSRLRLTESDPDSTLLTREGQAAGTLEYMSPEQVRGRIQELDARTDVYSLGAMLYALLAGQNPYGEVGRERLIDALLSGPPSPISRWAPNAPAELVAIAEKAMAWEPAKRYADMRAMADDLRAYLEGRVVGAYERGAWAELRKWIGRNKGLFGALAGLVLAIVLGAIGVTVAETLRRGAVEAKQEQTQLMLDRRVLADLAEEVEALWPEVPARIADLRSWLDRAAGVQSRLAFYRARSRRLEQQVAAVDSAGPLAPGVAEGADRLELGMLLELAEGLPAWTEEVERRLAVASALQERSIDGAEARQRWKAAAEDIEGLTVYRGLRIEPQLGLLPLRRDPNSGLWEFWHLASGEEPVLDSATGRWAISNDTGIVLVLLPGGETRVGAVEETAETLGQPYATWATWFGPESEWGVFDVELEPFFLSKYELVQGQFARVVPEQPPALPYPEAAHPMDGMNWQSSDLAARRFDLLLPTETQWEYGCRAGTTTQFFTGQEPSSVVGRGNCGYYLLEDDTAVFTDPSTQGVSHSPVGSFAPNAFGLHDTHGNVWEWCRDPFVAFGTPRPGDGLRLASGERPPEDASATASAHGHVHVMRGGNYSGDTLQCRASFRFDWDGRNFEPDTGVRLARALER